MNASFYLSLQIINIIKMDAGKLSDSRINVTRERDINKEERASLAQRHHLLHKLSGNERTRRLRRADNNIRIDQSRRQFMKRTLGSTKQLRKIHRIRVCAIDNHQALSAIITQIAGRQLTHLTRTD